MARSASLSEGSGAERRPSERSERGWALGTTKEVLGFSIDPACNWEFLGSPYSFIIDFLGFLLGFRFGFGFGVTKVTKGTEVIKCQEVLGSPRKLHFPNNILVKSYYDP